MNPIKNIVLILFSFVWTSIVAGGVPPDTNKAAYIVGLSADSGVDSDGNDFYDRLSVTADIEVVQQGEYSLYANLYSLDGIRILNPDLTRVRPMNIERCVCEPGVHQFSFEFWGQDIYWSRINDRYIVSLILFDSLQSQIGNSACTTSIHDYRDFGLWDVRVLSLADRGIDADGDGLFDSLEVKLSLWSRTAVKCTLAGDLKKDSIVVDHVFEKCDLREGDNIGVLRFSGMDINRSGLDGPYAVTLYIDAESLNGSAELQTSSYKHVNFVPPR